MAVPVVVNTAPLACPRGDPTIAAEWKKVTVRPAPKLCLESGRVGVCNDQLRELVDGLTESEDRKNKIGSLQARELAKCRLGDGSGKPVS